MVAILPSVCLEPHWCPCVMGSCCGWKKTLWEMAKTNKMLQMAKTNTKWGNHMYNFRNQPSKKPTFWPLFWISRPISQCLGAFGPVCNRWDLNLLQMAIEQDKFAVDVNFNGMWCARATCWNDGWSILITCPRTGYKPITFWLNRNCNLSFRKDVTFVP